jgi:hypothetical protein
MQEPSLTELGYLGDGTQIDSILNGTYVPLAGTGTDHYARLLLQEMQMPRSIWDNPKTSIVITSPQ